MFRVTITNAANFVSTILGFFVGFGRRIATRLAIAPDEVAHRVVEVRVRPARPGRPIPGSMLPRPRQRAAQRPVTHAEALPVHDTTCAPDPRASAGPGSPSR